MFNICVLEVTKSKDAARKYRPQFFLLEPAVTFLPFSYFVVERLMRVLKQHVQLVEVRAEVVLSFDEVL